MIARIEACIQLEKAEASWVGNSERGWTRRKALENAIEHYASYLEGRLKRLGIPADVIRDLVERKSPRHIEGERDWTPDKPWHRTEPRAESAQDSYDIPPAGYGAWPHGGPITGPIG